MRPKFCTISGFQITGEDIRTENQIKLMLGKEIVDLYRQGYKDFVCNCEMGVPIWAAEMLIELKTVLSVRLNIAVPFENQAKGFKELWRDVYYKVHEKADAVIFVSKQYKDGCYEECDRFMVDNSDMLLWVGQGESYITEYAEQQQKLIKKVGCPDTVSTAIRL
ncbi:MAG: SLOG family protein [Oscillospiraceae bacterium]